MRSQTEVACIRCGTPTEDRIAWRCSCGGTLRVTVSTPFRPDTIAPKQPGLWRYRAAFPYLGDTPAVTLGEGWSHLVPIGPSRAFAKQEFLLPTGSFKDRGSAVLLTAVAPELRRRGIHRISEDSSGNAGASMAAYAARAGFGCEVFVPSNARRGKLRQTEQYGAAIHPIDGSRDAVGRAAQEAPECAYLGHVWNPFFIDGMRTFAYEIAEQRGWSLPDVVVVPVSAGTLLLGMIAGFHHLHDSGVVDRVPRVVAVQSSMIAPLFHAMRGTPFTPPERFDGVADALISTNPPRLEEMVAALRSVKGDCVTVEDKETLASQRELAGQGIFVEPSSATVHAAWKRMPRDDPADGDGDVVLALTGSGLKTLGS